MLMRVSGWEFQTFRKRKLKKSFSFSSFPLSVVETSEVASLLCSCFFWIELLKSVPFIKRNIATAQHSDLATVGSMRASIYLSFLILVLAGLPVRGQLVLFAADGSGGKLSNLYILKKADGSVDTVVGQIGFAVTGLALNPQTGILYGSTAKKDPNSPGNLITINAQTGQGTVVGPYGFPDETMADLTFNAAGVLFGWLVGGAHDLFTISLANGQATLVGDSGLNTNGGGLAANSQGEIFLTGETSTGNLHEINPVDGSASQVANLFGASSSDYINALAFDEFGTLFGSLKSNVAFEGEPSNTNRILITINTSSGEITELGNSVDSLDALAFAIPEPSTYALSLVGALIIYSLFRKRETSSG